VPFCTLKTKGVKSKMLSIDDIKCKGCGICADACPRSAISLQDSVAVINQQLCIGCGTCLEICPVGAVRATVPVNNQLEKGGVAMQGINWFGQGYQGRGGMGRGMSRGRGRGRGMGIGIGIGTVSGRGNPYPFCCINPQLPMRWWAYGRNQSPQSMSDRYIPYASYR